MEWYILELFIKDISLFWPLLPSVRFNFQRFASVWRQFTVKNRVNWYSPKNFGIFLRIQDFITYFLLLLNIKQNTKNSKLFTDDENNILLWKIHQSLCYLCLGISDFLPAINNCMFFFANLSKMEWRQRQFIYQLPNDLKIPFCFGTIDHIVKIYLVRNDEVTTVKSVWKNLHWFSKLSGIPRDMKPFSKTHFRNPNSNTRIFWPITKT